jgi:uncharacterized protein YqgC (DUF456 family)
LFFDATYRQQKSQETVTGAYISELAYYNDNMEIVLIILAFLFLWVGLLGSIVPALPGPPLSYVGLLLLQWSGHAGFSSTFLWLWAAITIAVVVIDNILPMWLTKKFGGSRFAVIGSFLGLVIGMFLFPPIGLIVGPFLGALAGELLNNVFVQAKRNEANTTELNTIAADTVIADSDRADRAADNIRALTAALGAFLAFIFGTGAKLIISSLMIYYAIKTLL